MMNHAKFFNADSRRREHPYLVRLRLPSEKLQRSVNLAGGLPCPTNFPFKEATVTLHSGEVLHISPEQMEVAMQYGTAAGLHELVTQLREVATKLFNPPHMDERGLIVTGGAAHSTSLILQTFVESGDYVFVQESTYPTILDTLRPTDVKVVSVPNDSEGLRADLLAEALSKTPAARRKLLYVIPNGDNPTGITMSEKRRREIYEVVCKYDLLIAEDDPYYFIYFGAEQAPPTFLSLDTEGRVLRIDSFAKSVGPGLRLGYITADKPFTDKIQGLQAIMTGFPCTLSQVILSELLRHWGYEGFMKFTSKGTETYRKKRDMVLQAADKHLTGLCEWKAGDGMFLWLKVLGLEDTKHIIESECEKRDLILVPGSVCLWDSAQPSPYIRACYSLATPDKADRGFKILADVIKEELKKNKSKNKPGDAVASGHKEAANGFTHEPKKHTNGAAT